MKKLVVLVSGNGSNLQAVIDAVNSGELEYSIEAVVSNKEDAFALKRAEKAGIKTICIPFKKGTNRNCYDSELAETVKKIKPDYIFLLGWMRILTNNFISQFKNKILNLHPALPGTFPGTEAIEKQFNAFRLGQILECGIMTHYVPDEGVDSGPVIFTQKVPVFKTDSLEDFEKRLHEAEHKIVVKTLKEITNLKK